MLLFLCVQIVLLTLGSTKATTWLLNDYQPPSFLEYKHIYYIPHLLFSFTLSSSLGLFLLVFCDIIQLSSNTTRSYYWQWHLHLLLLLTIVILPWFQLYTFFHVTRAWRKKSSVVFSTLLWSMYLGLFYSLDDATGHTWFELGILRISMLGTTLISMLSGFGIVNTPYTVLMMHRRYVSDHDYSVAEQAYQQTKSTIQDKERLLQDMPIDKKTKGWLSFLNSNDARQVLQTETEQLKGLAANMKSDLEELEYSRAKTKFTQTWQGTLWRWVEWIFAVYCIYKWIATTCNVLFNRTGSSDPITTMLSIFLSQQDDPVDTAFWSQQLSFWFAGMIVVGSIRGFLKLWIRLLHLFQLNLKLAPSHMLLFTAHMMGMYFLSSVLMMQMSLPTEYRYLLSTVEFDFFRHWSDVIVVVSSCVSCIVMYVIYSTHDAKSMVIDFADVQLVHLESGK